uniref:HDC14405 n=1 Tax=Drosophila melanogaster TaxID=7227 RepID=Q6IJR2_DROME|nr:TPA_inf: HDC14405 [Drosophila melanogaster]
MCVINPAGHGVMAEQLPPATLRKITNLPTCFSRRGPCSAWPPTLLGIQLQIPAPTPNGAAMMTWHLDSKWRRLRWQVPRTRLPARADQMQLQRVDFVDWVD